MMGSRLIAVIAVITALVFAVPVAAQVELRFFPGDQHVAEGDSGSLSVMLDDTLEVRTVELFVSYDDPLVASLSGHPGTLFATSGCSLFPFFDEDEPGAWYGGSVTMGPDCFVTGPGELYRWDFKGLVTGICHVRVDSVVLYDPLADIIAGVSLAGTTITIGEVAASETVPSQRLTLSLTPNPFNPRTTIRFDGRPEELLTVAVFDLAGRRVDTLWRGRLGPDPGEATWDGTDGGGRAAPSGVYLFRIFGQGDRQTFRKGILLK